MVYVVDWVKCKEKHPDMFDDSDKFGYIGFICHKCNKKIREKEDKKLSGSIMSSFENKMSIFEKTE